MKGQTLGPLASRCPDCADSYSRWKGPFHAGESSYRPTTTMGPRWVPPGVGTCSQVAQWLTAGPIQHRESLKMYVNETDIFSSTGVASKDQDWALFFSACPAEPKQMGSVLCGASLWLPEFELSNPLTYVFWIIRWLLLDLNTTNLCTDVRKDIMGSNWIAKCRWETNLINRTCVTGTSRYNRN